MKPFREHLDYVKNNPENFWFKRKLYGWGWTPATKEGWFLTAFFIFSILYIIQTTLEARQAIVEVAVVMILFLFIVYLKGEKPKWQWGLKNKKKD